VQENSNKPSQTKSEQAFFHNGGSIQGQATLCIGLKGGDGSPLLDLDKDPWNDCSLGRKTNNKPNNAIIY
jgi:hypothetical protein